MNESSSERIRLVFAQVFVGAVLLALAFSSGQGSAWPLIHWPMYSAGNPVPPERVSRVELRALDFDGEWHVIQSMDLLSLDDVSSAQGDGILWISRAFAEQSSDRERFFPALAQRVEAILGREIVVLEARDLKWPVNFDVYPPIQFDQPDEVVIDGRYDVLLHAESNTAPDDELDLIFGAELGLLASTFPVGTTIAPCETVVARTWWRALLSPTEDYHVTVVLADANGVGQVSQDRRLAATATSQLEAGAVLFDAYTLDIPCDFPPGEYRLLAALYSLDDRQNQPIFYADGTFYGEYAVLTTVTVTEEGAS
jgi:hypothetical protein